jgi:hypothetical protein
VLVSSERVRLQAAAAAAADPMSPGPTSLPVATLEALAVQWWQAEVAAARLWDAPKSTRDRLREAAADAAGVDVLLMPEEDDAGPAEQ